MTNDINLEPQASTAEEAVEPVAVDIVSLPPELPETADRLYWIREKADAIGVDESESTRRLARAIRDLATEAMDLVNDAMTDLAEEPRVIERAIADLYEVNTVLAEAVERGEAIDNLKSDGAWTMVDEAIGSIACVICDLEDAAF